MNLTEVARDGGFCEHGDEFSSSLDSNNFFLFDWLTLQKDSRQSVTSINFSFGMLIFSTHTDIFEETTIKYWGGPYPYVYWYNKHSC
jgi:hypothetical protein